MVIRLLYGIVTGWGLMLSLPAMAEDQAIARLRTHAGVEQVNFVPETGFLRVKGNIPASPSPGLLAAQTPSIPQQALDFLLEHADIFGASNASEWQLLERQRDDHGIEHLVFQRLVAGWPLLEGQIKVHINAAGHIAGVNGNLKTVPVDLPGILAKVSPAQLQPEAALTDNIRSLFSGNDIHILRQQFNATLNPPFLIGRYDVLNKSTRQRYDITLNPLTGELLGQTLRLKEFNHGRK